MLTFIYSCIVGLVLWGVVRAIVTERRLGVQISYALVVPPLLLRLLQWR